MKEVKTIIFDYDGTLHNGLIIYAPAFRLAYGYLQETGYISKDKKITNEEIGSFLGYNNFDIWDFFGKDIPKKIRKLCDDMITEGLLAYIRNGKAKLYDNALEVLENLKNRGYELVFLSNCLNEYMNTHKTIFNLDKYFSGFYCCEDYGFIPKTEIFLEIKKEFPGEYIVIGDRFHDLEVAQKYNLKSIGCTYGYGSKDELKNSDILIDNIKEIEKIIL